MAETKIEWATYTFNPWWGCTKVSPACAHCYAETWAKRSGHDTWGANSRRRFFGEKHWHEPLKWDRKAAEEGTRPRVFCASMADVFEQLPDDHPDREQMERERGDLFAYIHATPNLDWLILTKRPDAMAEYFSTHEIPANVWAGTTVENQEAADQRIPFLLQTPASVRFLSVEPLLGAIRLDQCAPHVLGGDESNPGFVNAFNGLAWHPLTCRVAPSAQGSANGVRWVIVGGESGPGARPMHPDWVRSLRDQCVQAGVSFFFKQWGEWMPREAAPHSTFRRDGVHPWRDQDGAVEEVSLWLGKKTAGRLLEGREWSEFPVPNA